MLPRFPLVSVMSLTGDVSAGTAACSWKINEELNLEQEGSRVPFPGCTSASKYSAARLNLGERSNPHFQAPLAQLCVGPSLVLCACSRAQLRVSRCRSPLLEQPPLGQGKGAPGAPQATAGAVPRAGASSGHCVLRCLLALLCQNADLAGPFQGQNGSETIFYFYLFFFLTQEDFHPQGQHQRGNEDTCMFLHVQELLLQLAVPAAVGGELWGSAVGLGCGAQLAEQALGTDPALGTWTGGTQHHPVLPTTDGWRRWGTPRRNPTQDGDSGSFLGLGFAFGDLHPPGLSPKSRAGPGRILHRRQRCLGVCCPQQAPGRTAASEAQGQPQAHPN